jgi:CheY-like chemotaxis protein
MTDLIAKDLPELLRKYKSDTEIYHELMHFRIREILLVTTLYDAFILEQEDQLTEQIFGEYYNLNLSTAPRITNAPSGDEAMELLEKRHFDMVILTMRISGMNPFELSRRIRSLSPNIPIFLLLYDNSELQLLGDRGECLRDIDKVFVWNRDAKIFLAMIKYYEDKVNVINDTKVGLVRVILLVENSIRYYSRYLPVLYTEIIKQTQKLISEEHISGVSKILRMTARPKVLFASNYEEAIEIFERYKDYLLCVISDVKFPREGKIDEHAGFELIKYVKSELEDLPALIQSSDPENLNVARELKSSFINKNSESLSADLTDFILQNLGFGDFVLRDFWGKEIERASSMKQFRKLLKKVPDETLLYHAHRNHFSAWLMARGEILLAKKIQPVKVSDFPNALELRNYLVEIFENVDYRKVKGKTVEFDESLIGKEDYIIRLADGSMGGKCRGMAFINTLIQGIELDSMVPSAKIMIPKTAIIGTQEYDSFLEKNKLDSVIYSGIIFDDLKRRFIRSHLSKELVKKLRTYLKHVTSPLAVRSSGLFEDSISESFSGVYQTFLLPNNHPNFETRLKHLESAVKLVYASVFSKVSRSYFEAINYKIEDEKMAVIIQEVVGNLFGHHYYPDISGVAQSYNFYPISYMKPGDGISIIGVGLGKYVIDGEKAFRFSPKHPKLDMVPPEVQLKDSQSFFYAIDMSKNSIDLIAGEDITLTRLKIEEAEREGRLEPIASVWDAENNRLKIGLNQPGPRIINFAHILKYDSFPLAKILRLILDMVKDSMGTPVEIEFALDLSGEPGSNKQQKKPAFYILQIKPLIRDVHEFTIDTEQIEKDRLFLYSERGMGNGKIEDIYDVIYCNPEKFDKAKTVQMASELERLNKRMKKDNRKYILIGPGRWGTRDRWLGIPVVWTQISNAKIIVEAGLKDFHVDASLGSHFFHNITSMNIGYFNVPYGTGSGFVDWTWLKQHKPSSSTHHFNHVRFDKPMTVLMDGRKGVSLIYKA